MLRLAGRRFGGVRLVCWLVVLVMLAQAHVVLAASTAPDGGSVGAALGQLMDQVKAAMTAAGNASNAAAVEAGRDLALAISSTQNVYAEDLNKPLDGKVPPALKATVAQLGSAIDQLKTMSKESVQEAAAQAEQISNSLPYAPQEPRLAKFTPRFLVPAKETYLLKMKLSGAFENASKPEFFPTLVIQTHAYKPVASSASEIEYAVPSADLFAPGVAAGGRLRYVNGSLKAPWLMATMMGKRHVKKDDNFTLLMPVLPPGPGTIKFMAKSTRLEAGKPQRHTSQTYHQCSGRSCGGDDVNHLWAESPDANCQVVRGSSSFEVNSSGGDWKKEFLGDAGDVVSYSVSTTRRGAGMVDFQLSFTESCGKMVANDVGEDVPLAWGETRTLKAPAGTWRVALTGFDGTRTEFTETNTANPLLKVTATGDTVTLTAADAGAVVVP